MLNEVMGAVRIKEEKDDDAEPRSSLGKVDDERGKRQEASRSRRGGVAGDCMSDRCTGLRTSYVHVHPEYLNARIISEGGVLKLLINTHFRISGSQQHGWRIRAR